MRIGGLQKSSLIDYPGKISAVIFTQGCNFKCPYCHNPELIPFNPIQHNYISESEILEFLFRRKNILDGICITGGEPVLQNGLTEFCSEVKKMGFLIKLDTNGSKPDVIAYIAEKRLVDYFAMDIKTSYGKYEFVTGVKTDSLKIKESAAVIMESGIDYEFRTTLIQHLIETKDVLKIGEQIYGAKHYVLQRFVASKTLTDWLPGYYSYTDEKLKNLKEQLEILYNLKVSIR